jgi:MerR family transcriptional regulator, light-induced transcriptional regulator
MSTWLSTTDAASRLGISVSTLKRICDANEIALVRTPGGHRRIDNCQFELVASLLRSRNTKSNHPALQPDEVVQLLLKADHAQLIERFWSSASNTYPLIELLEDVLVPALWKIGDLWFNNAIETAHEKISTRTGGVVIDGLLCRFPTLQPPCRTFVGGSFPPSHDTLASKLLSLALRSIDVQAVFLGCSIEPEIIGQAATLLEAEAVWISHTHITNLECIVRDHQELRLYLPEGTRVLIGGGGLSPTARRLLIDCEYYDSLQALLKNEKSAIA